MVIARLYESELDDSMPVNQKRLLYQECLGCDADGENQDVANMSPDPFVRSMAYWILKDYSAALGTLLEKSAGSARKSQNVDEDDTYASNPDVFNFYNYLRTHPLLIRQHLASTAADKSQTVLLQGFTRGGMQGAFEEKNVIYIDRITPVERRLYFQTAHTHFKNGCPMLALEVLSELPDVIDMDSDITKSRSAESMTAKSSGISTGNLAHPVEEQKASDMDWSQPLKTKDTSDAFDWGAPVSSTKQPNDNLNSKVDEVDWGAPVTKFEEEELDLTLDGDDDCDTKSDSEVERKDKLFKTQSEEQQEELDGQVMLHKDGDIMAQQLKFIACLKMMMEELSTLATGFEVDGGQLRYQLYIWLEREADVLKKTCTYGADIQTLLGGPSTGM